MEDSERGLLERRYFIIDLLITHVDNIHNQALTTRN